MENNFLSSDDIYYDSNENNLNSSNIFSNNDTYYENLQNELLDENEILKRKIDSSFEEVFDCIKNYSNEFDRNMIDELKNDRSFFNQIIIKSLRVFSPNDFNTEKIIDCIDYDYISGKLLNLVDKKLSKNNEETNVSWWYTSYKNACEEEIKKYDYNADSLDLVCKNMIKSKNTIFDIKNGINYDSTIENYLEFFDEYMKDKNVIIPNGMKSFLFNNIQSYIMEANKVVNGKNSIDKVNDSITCFKNACGIHVEEEKKRESDLDSIFIY